MRLVSQVVKALSFVLSIHSHKRRHLVSCDSVQNAANIGPLFQLFLLGSSENYCFHFILFFQTAPLLSYNIVERINITWRTQRPWWQLESIFECFLWQHPSPFPSPIPKTSSRTLCLKYFANILLPFINTATLLEVLTTVIMFFEHEKKIFETWTEPVGNVGQCCENVPC